MHIDKFTGAKGWLSEKYNCDNGIIDFETKVGNVKFKLSDITNITSTNERHNMIFINFEVDGDLYKVILKYCNQKEIYENLLYLTRHHEKAVFYEQLKQIKKDPKLLDHLLLEAN